MMAQEQDQPTEPTIPNELPAADEPSVTLPAPEPKEPAGDEPDGGGDSGGETKQAAGSWKQKKAERLKLREEAERARQENEHLKSEMARIREETAELRGRVAAQQQSTQRDPYQDYLDKLESEADTVLAAAAEGKAPMKRFHEIQREMSRVVAQREYATLAAQQAANQPNATREAEKAMLKSEFPWFGQNPEVTQWADGEFYKLLAKGRPQTIATAREALAKAAAEYGLGETRPRPGNGSAYRGMSTKTDGNAADGDVSYRLDAQSMALAEATWPDLPPKKAYGKLVELLAKKSNE